MPVLPCFAVDERLERRERQESDNGARAWKKRSALGADQVIGFGQQIGQRSRHQDTRGEGHERVQAVAQAHRRCAAQKRGEKWQDCEGDDHDVTGTLAVASVPS